MNPENKITGNAANDDEKDLNVERWLNDAISSLAYVLLPFFKEQIRVPLIMTSMEDNLADSDYSSIKKRAGLEFLADIRNRPQYMMKQKLISELMSSFSNSFPNISRELGKIDNSTLQQLATRELDHFEHVKRRRIQQNKCKHNYGPVPNKVIVAKYKSRNRRYEHCHKCHKTRLVEHVLT
jgi:hypothetical protein